MDVGENDAARARKNAPDEIDVAGGAQPPLNAKESPDYVIAIEGDEPMRILQNAKEDLHDTVFLNSITASHSILRMCNF